MSARSARNADRTDEALAIARKHRADHRNVCPERGVRTLAVAIERALETAEGAALEELGWPVVHHMTLMLEQYGRHDRGCVCSADQATHAADCDECDCGLAEAMAFGIEWGGPIDPGPMTPEEEARFNESGKRIVDRLLAELKAKRAEPPA